MQRPSPFHIPDTGTPVVLCIMYHHIGMGIVRSLGRLGITVHAIEPDHQAPGLYSKYLTGEKFYWDVFNEPGERTIEFLQKVGRRIGRRSLLIPTTDELSILVDEHASELREWYIFPGQDPALSRTLVSKKEMYFLARDHGVPAPTALFPSSLQDVEDFAPSAQYPVMVKGIDGNLLAQRTGKKMFIVNSASELIALYRRSEDAEHPNIMLQEYIPGGDDSVWMFNGYFNDRSDCLFAVTGKKIRQAPVYTGYTSLGICLSNTAVRETTIRFMKEIGYRGILDIGYRFDRRDGLYKVLDINPRVGATFRLFVGRNGLDVVRALYLDLTGQPVPPTEPIEGRKWLVEERDLISTLRYIRDGKLTLRAWWQSFTGVQEAAWFAGDDLKPFLVMCLNLLMKPVSKFRARATARKTRSTSPQQGPRSETVIRPPEKDMPRNTMENLVPAESQKI